MYVAFFCPHCGGHLNEVELEDDHTLPSRKYGPQHGLVTCGWCHEPGQTYSHVVLCRIANQSLSDMKMRALGRDLAEMLAEFDTPDVSTMEP
jgi:hypothetical protein